MSLMFIIKSLQFSENVYKQPRNRSKCLILLKKAFISVQMFLKSLGFFELIKNVFKKPRNLRKTITCFQKESKSVKKSLNTFIKSLNTFLKSLKFSENIFKMPRILKKSPKFSKKKPCILFNNCFSFSRAMSGHIWSFPIFSKFLIFFRNF
jgi:hypothetical protein